MLTVQNLEKKFGVITAVNNCSFEVGKGEIVGLIGPNGSGKSTLFDLISGTIKPTAGEIYFNRKKLIGKSPEHVSGLGISRLFQQSRLFNNLSVMDNLLLAFDNRDIYFWKNLFGRDRTMQQKKKGVKKMLSSLGIERCENELARDLSYGQKRLVGLIQSVLHPHELLLLDEPVAGINPTLREKILALLIKERSQGKTILLIEHDMDFVFSISDKIYFQSHGKLITEGRPEEIINNSRVRELYLGE
jgi:branched-chain amino acid transport system ATP-binding protein